MKKFFATIMFIILIFSLTSCNNEKSSNETSRKTETIELKEMSSNKVKSIVGFTLDSFNIETDDQVFFDVYHAMTSCKEGYYFTKDEFLYFIDKDTLQTVPLCNKPDCEHNIECPDCNAYLPVEQYLTYFGLYYYNSNIYILGTDSELNSKSLYLYEISKDGKERNKKCKIVDFGSSVDDMKIQFIVHKGIGYISYGTDKKAELFSFNIDDKDGNLIKLDEIQGIGAEIYRLQGCDNGISYQYGCFTDNECNNFEGGIRVIIDNEKKTIVDNAIKTYIIAEGKVYYETTSGTKINDLSSGKTTDFKSKGNANSIIYDGRYFYLYDNMLDNNYKVYVYDKNQNLINTINTSENCFELLFGDKDYFFRMDTSTEEDETTVKVYVIDKANIEKSTQWQLIYEE